VRGIEVRPLDHQRPSRAKTRETPWLFEAYAALAGREPWLPLVSAPTPVERLDGVSEHLGAEVWVKRDDLSSPVYGGNKPRKLEFLLADARAQGRTTLITCGGLGTNHGLATAIYGGRHGFDVILGLRAQPVTDHVRTSLRLFHAYGAAMRLITGGTEAYERFETEQRAERPDAYFIPSGGSTAVGALGFVDAGLELARQVEQGVCPAPRAIFVATGTCGTLAGLVLGLKLAGVEARTIGVQVASRHLANPDNARRLATGALELLRRHDPAVPDVSLDLDDFALDTDHFGPGYGHPTDAGVEAIALVREAQGITLDLTYTGKAFAALIGHVRSGRIEGPVLFWNTFSSVDLSATAAGVETGALPEPFQQFFQDA
jgi:D-cysteine desulfhydrase